MNISFHHIGDGKFAAFRGSKSGGRNRRIIFPDGFLPKEGEPYDVEVTLTRSGRFTHEGERFDLCFARLANSADIFDQVNVMYRASNPINPLQEALSRASC